MRDLRRPPPRLTPEGGHLDTRLMSEDLVVKPALRVAGTEEHR